MNSRACLCAAEVDVGSSFAPPLPRPTKDFRVRTPSLAQDFQQATRFTRERTERESCVKSVARVASASG